MSNEKPHVLELTPLSPLVREGRCACGWAFHLPERDFARHPASTRRAIIAENWLAHVIEEERKAPTPTPPTPQADPETEEPPLGLGQTRWHSSDDCGPDVGIEIGLADGKRLWVGEIAFDVWDELDLVAKDGLGASDAGWWLMLYPERELLAKFADMESGRQFADVITAALLAGRQPNPTLAPAVDDAMIDAPVAPYSIREEPLRVRRFVVVGPDADDGWLCKSQRKASLMQNRLNIAFSAGVQAERDAARQNQEAAAGQDLRPTNAAPAPLVDRPWPSQPATPWRPAGIRSGILVFTSATGARMSLNRYASNGIPLWEALDFDRHWMRDNMPGMINSSFMPWLVHHCLLAQAEADAANAAPALMPWPDRSVTPFVPWGKSSTGGWSFRPRLPTLGESFTVQPDEQTHFLLAGRLCILPRWLAEHFPLPGDGRFVDWVRQHIELAEQELPF